ncbi:MAG: hypothetical protein K0R63_1325 [Rickettsiales bacterium]|jgi:hypothetical protein|nr:hypothetical protein [Rickettsiales bacterium]
MQNDAMDFIPIIRNLGVMNQYLISRSLDLGMLGEARELKQIDTYLIYFLQKSVPFDFAGELAQGKTLLVGEGNLSFCCSLAVKYPMVRCNLTATTFETITELSDIASDNGKKLKSMGVTVLHGVDATELYATFRGMRFDNIVFQFPHVGSREPIEGHNPNFILMRDFLKSAKYQLTQNGKVFISAVDNPHYQGAFQCEEAADTAGFYPPESYPFEPSDFPGYDHTMTHQDGSAIENHKEFCTWVFRKK